MKKLTEAGPAAPAPAAAGDSTAVTRVTRTEERLIWGTEVGPDGLPVRLPSWPRAVLLLSVRRSATAAAAAAAGDSEELGPDSDSASQSAAEPRSISSAGPSPGTEDMKA